MGVSMSSERSRWRYSLHALFGVHCVAAGVFELASAAPLIAGLLGACASVVAVQAGVLAACTRGLRRGGTL
jgi:hypothetical protein